jgi:DNA ligase (NAD+)
LGKLKEFADLFTLQAREESIISTGQLEGSLMECEGYSIKSLDNIFTAINNRKNVTFERFIYGLGIRNVGTR